MRVSSGGARLSVFGLIIVTIISMIHGADYWQATIAGSMFGIWLYFVSGERD
jgi:hypothetical protein